MDTAERKPRRIIVLGGGAAGLELAIRLARGTRAFSRAQVVLVDQERSHIWKPRWHELAVGLLVAAEEKADFAAQARRHGFTFELGEVEALDLDRREAALAATPRPAGDPVAPPGDLLPARRIGWDLAVLAVGSTVDDFGTPGVREHAYTLDTAEASGRVHAAVLAQAERVAAGLQPGVRVVIVGAGTTGVELAGELRTAVARLEPLRSLLDPARLHVTVVEAASRPLPGSPGDLSDYARRTLEARGVALRLGAKVTAVEADAVALEGGARIGADLVVWASGVKAQGLAAHLPGVRHVKGGRVEVDETLRVLGEDGRPRDDLHALGDCAALPSGPEGKPLPATAQVAQQQARHLARSLARQLRGRAALPFRYHDRGTLVSLGEGGAQGELPAPGRRGPLKITGAGARLAYAGLYRAHLAELFGVRGAAALALSAFLRRSARPSLKLPW